MEVEDKATYPSKLIGKKRSRPDDQNGEVDNETSDVKRLKKIDSRDKVNDKDLIHVDDDVRMKTSSDLGGNQMMGQVYPIVPNITELNTIVEQSPMIKQMNHKVSESQISGPTNGDKTKILPMLPAGNNGEISRPSESSSRPLPFSMRSGAMNNTMNGCSDSNLLREQSDMSLSSVQVKLNTKFSYNRPKPKSSELIQDKDENIPLLNSSTTDEQHIAPNIHEPKKLTKVTKIAIEIPPTKTALYIVMFIMFLLNVLTTYLLLALYFVGTNVTTNPDSLLQLQLSITIMSNIVATIGLSNWIAPQVAVQTKRHHPHIIPPSVGENNGNRKRRHLDKLSNVTLRQFLSHDDGFHLALAPSFFGFYVYFGALTAFHESVLSEEETKRGKRLLPVNATGSRDNWEGFRQELSDPLLKSVAGASAGAMAAVLLASGLNPRESAEFASSMTLDKFADFPGLGGAFKGNLFENIMVRRLKRSRSNADTASGSNERSGLDGDEGNVQLQEGLIPVAVTGFDILTMKEKVLKKGCMGKAARASATFPGLFQPCHWQIDSEDSDVDNGNENESSRHLLIDGGVRDPLGLVGLRGLRPEEDNKRIINLVAGEFGGWSGAVGPSQLPEGINASEVVSISIENAPQCGPWAMSNGPKAVEASMNAMIDVLDAEMYHGNEEGHYVLRIDVNSFIPNQ